MQIRPATVADAAILARLNAHVHQLHVEAEPSRYRPSELAEVEAWMRKIMAEDGDSEVFIAFDDRTPIGHVIFRELRRPASPFTSADACLMVDQLAVADRQRRGGVGRALMDAVAEAARAREIAVVRLDVRSHNIGAIAFYDALGYVECGRQLELHV